MTGRHRRPLAIRTRLLAGVVGVVAAALVVLVVGFNVALRRTLDHDASSLATDRARAALASVEIVPDGVSVAEATDDALVDTPLWIFAGDRLVEGPQATVADLEQAALVAARTPPRELDVAGAMRLVSVPIDAGGRRVGAVVAGVPLAPYRATARTALVGSIVLALVLLGVVALAAAWTLRRALGPVLELTRQAAAWSEHDLDRRFAPAKPHDELTELAATLDQLLARIAASLRREQRFSDELAHELRTPLARISAECELARRDHAAPDTDAALAAIAADADEMRRTIDALVGAARHRAGARHGVAVIDDLLVELAAIAARDAPASRLELGAEERARRIAVDHDLALRIIRPVVENALRHAASEVRVTTTAAHGQIVLRVVDDGPGVAASDCIRIFEPGERGSTPRGPGAGLGLALARRLARDIGGDVVLAASVRGAAFEITFPEA